MKKNIIELSLQIIPVMIGVFLGFMVSDCADKRKNTAQVQTLVGNIISEIEANHNRIAGVIDYHQTLRDSSRYYASDGAAGRVPDFFQGTRIQPLGSSAYDTGIQTGIINGLPLRTLQTLNQIYTYQKAYNELGKILISGLMNKDFSDTPESNRQIATFLAVAMTDVVIQENNLLEGYIRTKEALEAAY